MNYSASRSDPLPMRENPERPPPADGDARQPITPTPVPTGPVCSSINLRASAGEVAEARRFVASFVKNPALVGDAVLCVSELAANAVIHSNSRFVGGRFTVAAERYSDGRFRIKVLDDGGRWIERSEAEHAHLGLMIVNRLASTWGIQSDGPDGRSVWFELRPALSRTKIYIPNGSWLLRCVRGSGEGSAPVSRLSLDPPTKSPILPAFK